MSQRHTNPDECDGDCVRCPRQKHCIVSRVEKIPGSGYSSSGDSEFDSRMLKSIGYSTRYSHKGLDNGFSDPRRDYPSDGKDYSSRGESQSYSEDSSPGFHGSYEGSGEGYSGETPRGGKSNYSPGACCGK